MARVTHWFSFKPSVFREMNIWKSPSHYMAINTPQSQAFLSSHCSQQLNYSENHKSQFFLHFTSSIFQTHYVIFFVYCFTLGNLHYFDKSDFIYLPPSILYHFHYRQTPTSPQKQLTKQHPGKQKDIVLHNIHFLWC